MSSENQFDSNKLFKINDKVIIKLNWKIMNCRAMAASGHSLKCFLLSLFLNLDSHIGEGEISFFFLHVMCLNLRARDFSHSPSIILFYFRHGSASAKS